MMDLEKEVEYTIYFVSGNNVRLHSSRAKLNDLLKTLANHWDISLISQDSKLCATNFSHVTHILIDDEIAKKDDEKKQGWFKRS